MRPDAIDEAARIIRRGGTVVFPTETVYGIGADAFNDEACKKIFAAKERPADNPLITHVASYGDLERVADRPSWLARLLWKRFAPGPFTMIVDRRAGLSPTACANMPTVALRWPIEPIARQLITLSGTAIAAPSANPSGSPSATSFAMAYDYLNGKVDAIVDGGESAIGLESTIVTIAGNRVDIAREGAITQSEIESALADSGAVVGSYGINTITAGDEPTIPGRRHPHYQPRAALETLERGYLSARVAELSRGGMKVGVICLADAVDASTIASLADDLGENRMTAQIVDSTEEYARQFYRMLWHMDRHKCDAIVAEYPPAKGIGAALRNRLDAASGKIDQ